MLLTNKAMNDTLLISLISNGVTLLVATGGWLFAYYMQRDEKHSSRQKAKTERYEYEINARIELEKDACQWLAETLQRTPDAVK